MWLVKILWRDIGLAGAIGLILAVYPMVHHPKPRVVYTIMSTTNALQFIDTSAYHLYLDATLLDFTGARVVVYHIEVKNTGDGNVSPDLYDPNEPWGIRMIGATAFGEPQFDNFEPPELGHRIRAYTETRGPQAASEGWKEYKPWSAWDQYRDGMARSAPSETRILFSNAVFEAGNSFHIDMPLVVPAKSEPSFVPMGKIAGMKDFTVRDKRERHLIADLWTKCFGGGIVANVCRIVVVLAGAYLALAVVAFVHGHIDRVRTRVLRESRGRFLERHQVMKELFPDDEVRAAMARLYAEGGIEDVESGYVLYTHPDEYMKIGKFEDFHPKGFNPKRMEIVHPWDPDLDAKMALQRTLFQKGLLKVAPDRTHAVESTFLQDYAEFRQRLRYKLARDEFHKNL